MPPHLPDIWKSCWKLNCRESDMALLKSCCVSFCQEEGSICLHVGWLPKNGIPTQLPLIVQLNGWLAPWCQWPVSTAMLRLAGSYSENTVSSGKYSYRKFWQGRKLTHSSISLPILRAFLIPPPIPTPLLRISRQSLFNNASGLFCYAFFFTLVFLQEVRAVRWMWFCTRIDKIL